MCVFDGTHLYFWRRHLGPQMAMLKNDGNHLAGHRGTLCSRQCNWMTLQMYSEGVEERLQSKNVWHSKSGPNDPSHSQDSFLSWLKGHFGGFHSGEW